MEYKYRQPKIPYKLKHAHGNLGNKIDLKVETSCCTHS